MAFVGTPNEVVREDLSNEIILADVRNTPFSSRIKKGERLKAMEFSWTVEVLDDGSGVGTTPPPENADVTTFESDQQTRIYSRAQRYWRTPRVSVISEKVNDTAAHFGTYYRQVTKQTIGQKRNIERVMLSSNDSAADTGVIGSKMMGAARVINDGTLTWGDALTSIPSAFRTPTAQIYTGTLANLNDEATLINILKNRFDQLGMTTELLLFAGSSLKQQISTYFGKYTPNKSNFTTVVRTEQEAIDSRRFAAYGIDVFEGDFGTFELVLVPFIENLKWGYGINMDNVFMRPLMYCDHTELPYLGGGRSGLIDSILGIEWGDPRTHFKIAAT